MRLKITSIKYRATFNKGISFVAKTNIKGVDIVNEGVGFPTYLDGLWKDIKPFYSLKESELDSLVKNYRQSRAKKDVVLGKLTINF